MTTLPERLQAVIAEMRRAVKGEAVTSVGDWADRLEAAQALQAAPEGGDTMRGVCESADFEADTLTFRMVGAYYAAAGEYVITPAAPSPTAALQAGVGRFVACRCVSERDRELCMTKDECSKVYAYSDTAPKEPTK